MLAEKIRDIRRKHYLNQTAFANKIGVTQSAVSQWENGLTRPNSDQLRAISETFNISIDELLCGESLAEVPPDVPKTPEARSLAKGVDTMPPAQRKAIMDMMTGLYPGIFKKGSEEDDT